MIAALYVTRGGVYYGDAGIDPWDEVRDARRYLGPYPIVAHPPCQRWGKFWHGSTSKPHQFKLGDDNGCFSAALAAVWTYGGVIEHPADSRAWQVFNLNRPPRHGGWVPAGDGIGNTCYVEQGHYGHIARKGTFLYEVGTDRRPLVWGPSPQRVHPRAIELHGYEKARRIGMMAMVGGKRKTEIRNATPADFRNVLVSLAQSVHANTFTVDASVSKG